ncbi:MAG: hypothetical protein C3F02_03495 [Parcubacteria group bacterium]|nr:MAG: hypothetical protein C3F02_03495 [Parcubacteria group bacterium]
MKKKSELTLQGLSRDLQEVSREILEAIETLADHTDHRFLHLENELSGVKNDLSGVRGFLTRVVTKDYLDEKLQDLRGDLMLIIRTEDKKIGSVIKLLENRKVITKKDYRSLLALEPFPVR